MSIEQIPYKENREAALAGLEAHTVEKLPDLDMRYEEVSFVYKENDAITGRIVGHIHWDHLSVELFFLEENARGKGIGTKLLKEIEEVALEKQCKYAFLETMSFNAPVFYQKNGYHIMAQIENSPAEGETRYFMKKDF